MINKVNDWNKLVDTKRGITNTDIKFDLDVNLQKITNENNHGLTNAITNMNKNSNDADGDDNDVIRFKDSEI